MKNKQKQNNMKDGASPAGKDGDFENVDASVSGHTWVEMGQCIEASKWIS